MASLTNLPSFSRIGKNCSNLDIIRDLEVKNDKEGRIRSKGRSIPSYQSLAEVPPVLVHFNVDNGKRSRQLVSSPRIADVSQAARTADTDRDGLRFERVMRWDDFPTEARGGKDANQSHMAEGAGGREQRLKPKHAKRVVPSACFKTTEREHDHMTLRLREQGRLAPAPGHYDASQDIVRVKQDKLAYIANKDRPSAPSFQVERLAKTLPKSQGSAEMAQPTPRFSLRVLRELEKFPPNSSAAMRFLKQALMSAGMPPELSRPASRGRHSLHSTATSAKIGFADASSQEAERAEGEEEALVATASTGTTGSGADSQAFPVAAPALLDTANLGATGNLSHTSISLRTRSASSPEHIRGLDMSRMLPRYKPDTGAPTLCGYQVPKGTDSVEGDYNAVVGKHHIPTPDLSRSGKDHIDQLQRLGYVPPGSLASPVYPEYESPVNWAHPQGWMRATKAKSTGGHVSMDQMLPRRPATSQGSIGIELRDHRDGKMWDGCIPDDKNPSFPHTPSLLMGRSSSTHRPLDDRKSPCRVEGPYPYSERLIRQRTQQVIPFKKCMERRPLTAHGFTGKPIREVNDLLYDTHHSEMAIVRPRSLSPVDIYRSAGRSAVGGPGVESGSGGLHGTNYWGEIGWRTEAVANVIRDKRLPDMERSPGRKPPRRHSYSTELIPSELMNTAGLAAMQGGRESGILWNPKDSVTMRNIPTPNLDANARGRDTERAKRSVLAQDLLYDVKHDLTEPRIQAAVIYKGRSGR